MNKIRQGYIFNQLNIAFLIITTVMIREIFLIIGMDYFASILFYSIFIEIALLFFLVILSLKRIKKYTLILLFLWILIFLYSLLQMINLNVAIFSIERNIEFFSIMAILLFLIISEYIVLSNSTINKILNLNLAIGTIVSVFLLNMSNYNDAGEFILYTKYTNEVALFIYLVVGYVSIHLIKSKKYNKFKWIILLLLTVGLYLTRSRTAIFSFAFSIFIYIYARNNPNKLKKISGIVIIVSQVYPIAYVFLSKFMQVQSITIFGKPFFSARQIVWGKIFEGAQQNPFIGRYGEPIYQLFVGSSNEITRGAHNVFLNILWNYSVVAYIMTLFIFIVITKKMINSLNNKAQIMAFSLYLSYFIHMSNESSLISSGINYSIRAFFVLILIRNMKEVTNNE